MQFVQRTLIGQDAAINLELGFIPTYVEIYKQHGTITSASFLRWWGKNYEDDAVVDAADQEYGVIDTGGTFSEATADTGIQSFDGSKKPQVRILNPLTGNFDNTAVYGDYDPTVDYNSVGTIRSATVIGTIIRPTVHNGCVYELKTKTGTASTEPTWSTTPGEETTDGGSNVWICRKEDIVANKGLGITLGSTLAASSIPLFITAIKADSDLDLGTV